MFDSVFSTDYWVPGGGAAGLAGAAVQDQAPLTASGYVAPAMAWLGILLALVAIRVAYEFMD